MERIGNVLKKAPLWLGLMMLLVVAPLVGYFHANSQQAAAHARWGKPLTGKVVKLTSPVFGEAGLPVRTADIKFTGHDGKPVTVNRVIYYTNKVGEKFQLWQAKDGAVFISGDQGATGSFSLRYLAPLSYRTSPWPTTQWTFIWRMLFVGGGGYLLAVLLKHIGIGMENTAHQRKRDRIRVVDAA